MPIGAPSDDYQFVAWCYGVLSGYLDLHDQVMPEVTRIEFRLAPAGQQAGRRPQGLRRPAAPGPRGPQAVQGRPDRRREGQPAADQCGGRAIRSRAGARSGTSPPDVTKARVAQEWMSWTLPARCPGIAATLETRSKLLGASIQANAEPERGRCAGRAAEELGPRRARLSHVSDARRLPGRRQSCDLRRLRARQATRRSRRMAHSGAPAAGARGRRRRRRGGRRPAAVPPQDDEGALRQPAAVDPHRRGDRRAASPSGCSARAPVLAARRRRAWRAACASP